ncbi:MFS transporter [Paeniglutamicibacter sp. ZC-3]|uniref:MFS transporter n=1 Tax=Paeniglutamicibacter TaxID=1742990 RepID=UPI0021F6B707|nr:MULTISPECIES: MFS transporter [Paeniglutamicibacter]MCV9996354.1 MFS transporter [Paeniglutamicibacter sp. ZC-3]MDO2934425.1 MFS transporter [Paeniglutamicibacter sulfureus]
MSSTQLQSDRTLGGAIRNGRMNRRAWIITIMLVLFQIVAFADKAVLGLVAYKAIPELGISTVQFGMIGSAFFFLYAIGSVLLGLIAGRTSVKWVIFAMGLAWAVLQFPMLFGGGAAILLVTRILLGGAEGPATAMSLSSAHSWFKPADRALPSNLIAIGSTLGPVLAAPFLAFIISNFGWRWAFGALGLVGLAWVIAWFILGADGPFGSSKNKETAEPEAEAVANAPVREKTAAEIASDQRTKQYEDQKPVKVTWILLSASFLVAAFGGFTNFWTQGFLTTWSPKYLAGVVNMSPEMVALITTFPWIFGAVVLLALGFMGRNQMRRGKSVRVALAAPFGICLVLAGACFLALPFVSGPMVVVLLTLGAGFSVIYPMAPSAMAFAVGAGQRPVIMATLGGVASIGAIISPTAVGMFMQQAGYRTAAKGTPETAEMIGNMISGVNQSLTIAGGLLLAAGILSVIFFNPDKTGQRLQRRLAQKSNS